MTTPLDTILVPDGLIAGQELGLPLSEIGHDSGWMRENMEELKRRAAAEDEDMKELVGESEQSTALAIELHDASSILSNSVRNCHKLTTSDLSTLMRRPLPYL